MNNNTLTVKFDGRLNKLVRNLVYKDDYYGWWGLPKITSYLDEIWRYMNYESSNKKTLKKWSISPAKGKMIPITINRKDLRSLYESSDDLKAVAWLYAHARVLQFNVPENYWDKLIPTTTDGIATWDSTLVDITDISPVVIHSLLINEATKRWYYNSAIWHDTGIESLEPAPFVEVTPEDKTKTSTKKKPKEENKPADLAEAEHPEDDEVILEEHDRLMFGPKFGYVRQTSELKTFGETMKNCIIFDKPKDEKIVDQTNSQNLNMIELNIEAALSNALFEGQYPPLEKFTKKMQEKGINVYYRHYQIPSGYLILTSLLDGTNNNSVLTSVFIDPNLIFRNGYNVITTTHNGDIANELTCSLNDIKTIVRMAKGPVLTKKERKALLSRNPYGTRDVLKMVDFSGLGSREPFQKQEWDELMTNIYSVIKSGSLRYRSKLVNYVSPKKFTLLCDNMVLPLLPYGIGANVTNVTKPVDMNASVIEYDSTNTDENLKVKIQQLTTF